MLQRPRTDRKGYVCSGRVVKVVLAGDAVDDPEIRRYELRSGAGRKPQERPPERGTESKIVLRVCAEHGHAAPWDGLPELHLEEPVQEMDEHAASAWRVLDEARPVKSGKDRGYANVRRELLDPPCDGILAYLEQARAKLQREGRLRKAQLLE